MDKMKLDLQIHDQLLASLQTTPMTPTQLLETQKLLSAAQQNVAADQAAMLAMEQQIYQAQGLASSQTLQIAQQESNLISQAAKLLTGQYYRASAKCQVMVHI